jgi:outer membrane protein assembly factor BamB
MHVIRTSILAFGTFLVTAATLAQVGSVFRGDLQHSGTYPAQGISGPAWSVWEYQADGPVRGSAAISDGRVFVGSTDGRLYALDAATGAIGWVFDTGAAIASTPAVTTDQVIVTSRSGFLYSVNAADGTETWRAFLGADEPLRFGWDYLMSSPAVTDDAVVVGSSSGDVVAVDAVRGTERWRTNTGGAVRSSPAVFDGVVYVGSGDGYLYALDETSGAVLWRHETEGVTLDLDQIGYDRRTIDSSPAVTEDYVLHGSRDGHLYAVNRRDGSRAWRFDHEGSWVIGSPAIDDGRVFVGSSDGAFFQALDLDTGTEMWRFDTPHRVFSSASVMGGIVSFGCFDGSVFGLEAASGREVWRFMSGAAVISSPVPAGRHLYVGTDDGRLIALRGRKGPHPASMVNRIVYWGGEEVFRMFRGGEGLRDSLVARGYVLVDGTGLATLMEEFESDPTPTVIVAADESLPTEILYGGRQSQLRRYLDAGGKWVQLGLPPDALVRDSTGRPIALEVDRSAAILGVEPDRIAGDEPRLEATSDGLAWGHPLWTTGGLPVDPMLVSTVLARDEFGRAGSWVLHYGGAPGAGYVQMLNRDEPAGDPSWVMSVAEYGLVGEPDPR